MVEIGAFDAKNRLSELLSRAERGCGDSSHSNKPAISDRPAAVQNLFRYGRHLVRAANHQIHVFRGREVMCGHPSPDLVICFD
jgi:hypothetical protein